MGWADSSRWWMRSTRIGSTCLLVVLLAGCTGRGGGSLPPDGIVFNERATFGFSFSCEDQSNSTQQSGRLRIQLEYADHGTNPLGGPFSIHGVADTLDPVLESMICIGQAPPPGVYELIFLGTYWPTANSTVAFPAECRASKTDAGAKPCRFEVIVRDNDGDRKPSAADYFAIKLSNVTEPVSEFTDPRSIIYARAGLLDGGNVEVD